MVCHSSSFPGTIYIYANTNSCHAARYFKCQKTLVTLYKSRGLQCLHAHHGSERDYRSAEIIVIFHIENTEYIEEERLLSL